MMAILGKVWFGMYPTYVNLDGDKKNCKGILVCLLVVFFFFYHFGDVARYFSNTHAIYRWYLVYSYQN